jgi:hypothetical protein
MKCLNEKYKKKKKKLFHGATSRIVTNIVLGSVVQKQLKDIELFFKVELCSFFLCDKGLKESHEC